MHKNENLREIKRGLNRKQQKQKQIMIKLTEISKNREHLSTYKTGSTHTIKCTHKCTADKLDTLQNIRSTRLAFFIHPLR